MTELPLADELASVLSRMSGMLLSEETVASALTLVTSLVLETVPAARGAGITLVDTTGGPTSAAATDEHVARADRLQYELGEGPCLSAWQQRQVVRVDDSLEEPRWPRWCAEAAQLQVRSALSAPLVAGDTAFGAMKVYSAAPAAFGGREERVMGLFAAQAAILVANVQSHDNARRLSESLRAALAGRDLIGQAKGMVMQRDGVDGDTAFAMLAATSQQRQVKLLDVARALVATATRRRP